MSRHVMVVPADRAGCGYYRLIWPGQAVSLVRPGWTVSITPPEHVEAGYQGGRFIGASGFPDPLPDLLVMQRVGTPAQLDILRWAQGRGIATVVDFDDAMWCIDRDNHAWRAWNVENPKGQDWRICDTAAQVADLVTVTTDALARRYGRHGRFETIGNFVPKAATDVESSEVNNEFTAGWAGFTRTHPGDCRVSRPAAEAVLKGGGALRVVADGPGAAREWGVDPGVVDSIPPQKLGPDYFKALSGLDLMLVGLRDTPFNRSKSTLKVLEAAAMGVPSVAADNPPHRTLARAGFPVTLAATPAEWAGAATAAMQQWERLGAEHVASRMTSVVLDGYTIEGNAERWATAWERAMRRAGR